MTCSAPTSHNFKFCRICLSIQHWHIQYICFMVEHCLYSTGYMVKLWLANAFLCWQNYRNSISVLAVSLWDVNPYLSVIHSLMLCPPLLLDMTGYYDVYVILIYSCYVNMKVSKSHPKKMECTVWIEQVQQLHTTLENIKYQPIWFVTQKSCHKRTAFINEI